MVLLDSYISSELIYPPDYRIFHVGDNLKLIYGDKQEFYTIKARHHVPFVERTDVKWLLDPGKDVTAGDISDWLEPVGGELMIMAMSLYSDRNMEVKVKIPSSDQWFGTKKDSDVPITPELSPWKKPSVTLYSWGNTWVPSFAIKNPTTYKCNAMKIGITGYRYMLEAVVKEPPHYATVSLDILRP